MARWRLLHLLPAFGLLLFAEAASAQAAKCIATEANRTATEGQAADLSCNLNRVLRTSTIAEPTAVATAGITPVVSSAAEANRVLKASAGNLYGLTVTTGAAAGFVLVFNATSAPSDGAVTPIYCFSVPATTSAGISWPVPAAFSTGITVSFSTGADCFTKTASSTAFFSGAVK